MTEIERPLEQAEAASKPAASVAASENGSEVILYSQPQELPNVVGGVLIPYILTVFGSEVVCKAAVGAAFVLVASGFPLATVLLVLVLYQLWKAAYNLHFLAHHRQDMGVLAAHAKLEAASCAGLLLVLGGALAFLLGRLPAAALPFLVLPHAVICVARVCGPDSLLAGGSGFFLLLESVQLLFIAMKIAGTSGGADWTGTLLFYYVLVIGWLVLAAFMLLALLLLGGVMALRPALLGAVPAAVAALVGALMLYFVWNPVGYFLLLSGLRAAAEKGVAPFMGAAEPRLLVGGYVFAVCGGLTFLALLLLHRPVKRFALQQLGRGQPREISLVSFARQLQLKVRRVSENYLRRDEEGGAAAEVAPELGLCTVCMDRPADTMIAACGHSVLCQHCLAQVAAASDLCPLCRRAFDKAYIIFWDADRRQYMGKGLIRLRRAP